MSAKLLNAFADENQDLHRQIGCMTGIFQLFDRQHLLTGRRLNGQSPRRLPSGAVNTELHGRPPQVLDKNRSVNENPRFSMESARASFSSSSCSSSFSSLECNKPAVPESSLPEGSSLEATFKGSPNPHSRINRRTSIHSAPYNLSLNTSSVYPSRESVDFRDVVKDSIYRESNGLSVKTSVIESTKKNEMKHKDSPRPLPLSKSMDGSYVVAINGKPRAPMNLDDSLRVLTKLKESPWYFPETMEPPRSSYESRDGASFAVPKEAPRFSFDGRDVSRASLDYRDNKAAAKLRELPRLSLDSREGSLQNSNISLRSASFLKNDSEGSISSHRPHQTLVSPQDSGCVKRHPSVVAKLMGLEAMPNKNNTTADRPVGLSNAVPQKEIDTSKGQKVNTVRSKPVKMADENKQDRSSSPKLSIKEPDTPKKANCQARIPVETAPWSQQLKGRNSAQTGLEYKEARATQHHGSVYSEIERKLKDLEFQQSNKDLRALKQILDAIRAKGLLESKKGVDQPSLFSGQKTSGYHSEELSRSSMDEGIIQKEIHPITTLMDGNINSRPLESPIVIMKPAKSVTKYSISPPIDNIFDGPVGLPKVRIADSADFRRALVANQAIKSRVTTNSLKESEVLISPTRERKNINRIDKVSPKSQPRASRNSPRQHHPLPNENDESSIKTSSSLSPRLQHKKLLEKQSRPSTSHGSNKQSIQSRQSLESVSPRSKLRVKPKSQAKDGHSAEITEARGASSQIEEVYLRSEGNVNHVSLVEAEVTSANQFSISELPLLHANKGSSTRAATNTSFTKQNKSNVKEDLSSAIVTQEQPSPVSVLDSSFYRDNMPASPIKCSSIFAEDQEPRVSGDVHCGEEWKTLEIVENLPSVQPAHELSHKKMRDIEILVKKLRQLSQPDDKEDTCDHIASLCETQNPDHRYVSEILLASGLLLKDFSTSAVGLDSIELHKSGYPINPELFLVLEQKKSGRLTKPENVKENVPGPRTDKDRAHRKLLFDAVNEILLEKLQLGDPGHQPAFWMCLHRRTAQRNHSGQRLLKELCLEIDQMESIASGFASIESDEDDGITSILTRDIEGQSDGWKAHAKDVSGIVLDIERSIFKELINDVLNGEIVPGMQAKSNRRRRQLFAK